MRACAILVLLSAVPWCRAEVPLDTLTLPPGFHVAVYADQVPDARELALGPDGTVFAGSGRAGKVYALIDADHDGRAETVRVVASGGSDGTLYSRWYSSSEWDSFRNNGPFY